jgi:Transglutaminase-like superfamily
MTPPLSAWHRAHWGVRAGVVVVVLTGLSFLPYLLGGVDVTRARNALVLDSEPVVDWAPPQWPVDFKVDQVAPDPRFTQVVSRLGLQGLNDDTDRALTIARWLLTASRPLTGGPIEADLWQSYRLIVEEGQGDCAAFSRVFTALAVAAGIPVRQWAFSFNDYGGHGHVLPEIWHAAAGQWLAMDVSNNYLFLREGRPTSALRARQALLAGDPAFAFGLIHPDVRPGYTDPAKAVAYYRRGLPQWYLWWGANPFSYAHAPGVQALQAWFHAGAQALGMAWNVHPRIRLLADDLASPAAREMHRFRQHLLAGALALLCAFCLFVFGLLAQRVRARTPSRPLVPHV